MIKDDLLLKAAFSGSIAAVLANLTLYIFNLFIPGQNINMTKLSAEFFVNIDPYTPLIVIMGFIWSIVVGGSYAFVYLLLLNLTGWNNLWIKSIAVISAMWLLVGGHVMKVMEVAQYVRNEPLSVLAFYVAHLFFATYLSFIVSKLRGQA